MTSVRGVRAEVRNGALILPADVSEVINRSGVAHVVVDLTIDGDACTDDERVAATQRIPVSVARAARAAFGSIPQL